MRWICGAASVLMLAGCAAATPSHKPVAGDLRQIVYINPLPNDPVWDILGECMRSEGKKLGITIDEKRPPGGNVDIPRIEEMLSQAIATKAQAVAVWPGSPAAFDVQFVTARKQGTVIAALDPGTKNANFAVSGTADHKFEMYVDALMANQPGKHRIGALMGVKGGPTDGMQGLRAAVARHPGLTLVDVRFNQGTFTDDISLTKSMLAAHPDIDVLFNYSGFPGMFTALREARTNGRVKVYANGNFREPMLQYIDEGMVGGVKVSNRCAEGRLVVRRLQRAYRGQKVDDIERSYVVTPERYRTLSRFWV